MPRYTMNQAILAKIETTPGTDASPTGAANAILVANATFNPLNAQNVDRNLLRVFMGGSEQLVGTDYLECSFDVEFQSSGTAGTAAAWGPLVRACGYAETVTASARVEYNPISTSFESVTIYYHDDGVLHKMLMARGTFTLDMGIGNRPVFKFKFIGLDGGISATANPTETLSAWKTPLVITDTFTGDITLGAVTYTTGTLAGGTTYPSRGMTFDAAVKATYIPLLGGESVDITDRQEAGHFDLDLTAANEVSFMATVKGNSTQGFGFTHGTAAGLTMKLYAPAVQLFNPTKQDQNGRRLIGYDARFVPTTTGSGNDQFRLVAM